MAESQQERQRRLARERKRRQRERQTDEQSTAERISNRQYKRQRLSNETQIETDRRRKINRESKSNNRANRSREQIEERRRVERERIAECTINQSQGHIERRSRVECKRIAEHRADQSQEQIKGRIRSHEENMREFMAENYNIKMNGTGVNVVPHHKLLQQLQNQQKLLQQNFSLPLPVVIPTMTNCANLGGLQAIPTSSLTRDPPIVASIFTTSSYPILIGGQIIPVCSPIMVQPNLNEVDTSVSEIKPNLLQENKITALSDNEIGKKEDTCFRNSEIESGTEDQNSIFIKTEEDEITSWSDNEIGRNEDTCFRNSEIESVTEDQDTILFKTELKTEIFEHDTDGNDFILFPHSPPIIPRNNFEVASFVTGLIDISLLEHCHATLLAFLQDCKLLPCAYMCSKCAIPCEIVMKGRWFYFSCNNYMCDENYCLQVSLNRRSLFDSCRLTYTQVLSVVYCFVSSICLETTHKVLNISEKTLVGWYNVCGEICDLALLNEESYVIGGPGTTVELGKFFEGQVILGAIQRNSSNCFFVPITECGRDTQFSVIAERIKPGTTIISTIWKSKECLHDEDLQQFAINNEIILKHPDTVGDTTTIKSRWGAIKKSLFNGGKTGNLEGYLASYVWKRLHQKDNLFRSFLQDVSKLYPV